MDPQQKISSSPPPRSNQSDAQVQMLDQLQVLQQQNEYLKQQNKRIQKLLDQITCSNDNQRICQCGKKLCYLSICAPPMLSTCNKCHENIEKVSSVYWACFTCKYFACCKCEGYKRVVCPYSHLLQSKKPNADIEKQEQQQSKEQGDKECHKRICDICRNQIKSLYYCCQCGFDMCKTCRQK